MRIVVVTSMLILASCAQQKPRQTADQRICEDPNKTKQGEVWKCLHREAYRLARAPGSAKEIAEAVPTACAAELEKEGKAIKGDNQGEQRESLQYWAERASLYRVVQARA